jgi:hypothetical protein
VGTGEGPGVRALLLERPQEHPAVLDGCEKQMMGDDADLFKSPDLFLELFAGVQLLEPLQWPNLDHIFFARLRRYIN